MVFSNSQYLQIMSRKGCNSKLFQGLLLDTIDDRGVSGLSIPPFTPELSLGNKDALCTGCYELIGLFGYLNGYCAIFEVNQNQRCQLIPQTL